MSLYVSEKVGNEIVLKKYAPAVPVYRGFWAVTIGGFAGTLVECNGSMRYIGSNEKTIYQIVEPGTYTFTATRHGETKSKTIVLDDKDPNNSYTVNLGLYIGMQYLEYIESTGTQYIDTGVSGNNDNLKIECEFIITEIPGDWSNIYGNYVDENSNSFRLVINGNTHNGFFTSNTQTGQGQIGYNFQTNTKYTIESSYLKSIINSTTYNYSQKIIGDENNTTILLFNSSTISGFLGTSIKLYSFKIYDNDVLVSDMIPIKDDTGHGAMYDKVTQQIFYNSGEGEFICGPNKPYTRIQYLEGTTCEQYINTGIIPTSDMTYYGKFGFVEFISSQNILQVFGSRNISGTPNGIYASIRNTGIGLDFFDTNRYELSTSVTRDDVFDFAIEDRVSTIKKNGTVVGTYTFSTTTDTTDYPLHLNALISGGVVDNIKGTSRIYSFKILNHGTLVRDMVPILDNEGTPCMLDQVEDRLYYNSGIGEFIPGPAYVELEYIESTGTQYIDTGVRQSDYYKNLIMSAKFQFTNHDLENGFVAGCADSSRSQYYVPFGYDSRNMFLSNLGAGGTEILISPFDINIHTVIANSAESFVKVDSILYTISSNITNIPYNIYLFGRNSAGTTVYSKVRIYNLSFSTNNGIKIRDFIPVLDPYGVPCMLDMVEGKFYYNAGTGQFIAGPEKQ